MAKKVFKGFMQVTEGAFAAENGYIYFVRNSANTGATDGYLQFNGKKYGTAKELEADLSADLSELSAITAEIYADYLTSTDKTELNDAITAETAARETLSGRVDTIEADYLKAEDLTATTADIEALSAVSAETRIAALEAVSADSRITALESASAETRIAALEAVSADSRLNTLEALSAGTRISALEDSAHTHDNKSVLDAIDQNKVDAWDSMAGGANVVLSSYTAEGEVTEGCLKTYEIFQGGVSKGKIDIPKDLVVTSGQVTENQQGEKVLRLTIANQSEPVDILVSDLAHVYTEGDGIEISTGDTISAKVVAGNGLSVDSNGIAMALADSNGAGAMSASDFDKLASIAASADTNVLEGVQLNGSDVSIDGNKKANIVLPTATVSGGSNGVEVEVVESAGTITEVNVTAPDFANTYAGKTDFETLSGRVDTAEEDIAALSAVSADTRIAALEALTGTTSSAVQGVQLNGQDIALDQDNKANVELPSATVSGGSNGVSVEVVESAGTITEVNVNAPDFANTYAGKTDFETLSGRVDDIETGYTTNATYDAYTAATDDSIAALSAVSADTRIEALEAVSADSRIATLEAVSADSRITTLEAISAGTRLDTLEALTGATSSALQSVSAGDASVSVGTKDTNNDQTVAVAISSVTGNTLSLESDGLFAAVYYDGDDSD